MHKDSNKKQTRKEEEETGGLAEARREEDQSRDWVVSCREQRSADECIAA